MKQSILKFLTSIRKPLFFIGQPFTLLSCAWLKLIRFLGASKINDRIFMKIGVLPVLDDYYQPLINPKKHLKKSLREDRIISGIDLNDAEQLELLKQFHYNDEIKQFTVEKVRDGEFYFNNNMFTAGDADYLYNIIRQIKPKRVVEIGSGFSTMMASSAITKNRTENPNLKFNHICIEPYERFWLEKLNIELIRKKVEDLDISFFQQLEANDILFIDSSHVIRPQGDVLYEYEEILPTLKPGVIVHVHDIFTPKDYPDKWILDEHHFWNEQYLLETFLMFNNHFKIIGSLNYLAHHHREALAEKCPFFASEQGYEENKREPRSFWMIKTS